MKKLQATAVITLLIMIISSYIISFDYYKDTLVRLFDQWHWRSYGSIFSQVGQIYQLLMSILEITLAIIFFTGAPSLKERSYKLLRFLVVIGFILFVPFKIYYHFFPGSFFFKTDLSNQLIFSAYSIVQLFCFITFLIAKPQSQPPAIDLSQYELVAYTRTGHRFVHYLVDALFLLPTWIFWSQTLPILFNREVETLIIRLVLILIYLAYCFFSEAIFRQTLGKIATNSCVAGNGVQWSAGRALGRTLARLIPFNGISFLFGGNWHDKLSDTSVVYVGTWEKVFEDTETVSA
jgi:hypothetical protein